MEFVIDGSQPSCLVAFDVADPSNFAEHEGEVLAYEDELDT